MRWAGTHRQTAPRRGGRAAHQRGQCTEAPHLRRGRAARGQPAQSRGGPGSREDARRRACSARTACADTGGPRGLRVTRRQSRAAVRGDGAPAGLPEERVPTDATMGGTGPARPDEQGEGRQVAQGHDGSLPPPGRAARGAPVHGGRGMRVVAPPVRHSVGQRTQAQRQDAGTAGDRAEEQPGPHGSQALPGWAGTGAGGPIFLKG